MERLQLLRALDVVGPHRPEHVELVGAVRPSFAEWTMPPGRNSMLAPSPDTGYVASITPWSAVPRTVCVS